MDAFICDVPPVTLQEVLPSYRGQGSLEETRKAWRPRTRGDDGWALVADPPNYSQPRLGALRLGTAAVLSFRPAADANMLRPSPLRAKHQGDPV